MSTRNSFQGVFKLPYVAGILVSIGVALFARLVKHDRDRAFYPTVMIVVASYYVVFATLTSAWRS